MENKAMRLPLIDSAAEHAKDWLSIALLGLGISFAPYEWIGGMFLGLAAASFTMRFAPEKDRMELWSVLVGAFITSHVAAIVCQKWFPGVPVQLAMIGAGVGSRHLMRIVLRFFGIVEKRSGEIVNGVIDKGVGRQDKQ
jgi:CHASE2 domain-containing sensor protein